MFRQLLAGTTGARYPRSAGYHHPLLDKFYKGVAPSSVPSLTTRTRSDASSSKKDIKVYR